MGGRGIHPSVWYVFRPYSVDLANGQLYRDKELIPLRPRTLALLVFLVENAGSVLSKDAIMDAVWADVAVQDDTLRTSIWELRKALGDDKTPRQFIQTHHRRGFSFIGKGSLQSESPTEAGEVSPEGRRLRGPPLVGRQKAVGALRACINPAGGSGTVLCLVGGEAGVGKTRLLQEFVYGLPASEHQAVWATASDVSRETPFWLWLQVLLSMVELSTREEVERAASSSAHAIAAVFPSVGEKMGAAPSGDTADGPLVRTRFFDGMIDFLRNMSRAKPLLVVLDDIHLAGQSSLALLSAATQLLVGEQILFAVAYRTGEGNPDLEQFLSSSVRLPQVTHVPLPGLTRDEATELVRLAAAGLDDADAARIAEASSGVPYFVLEFVREAGNRDDDEPAAVPDAVQVLLRHRLRSCGPELIRFLNAAAVLGHVFDFRIAARAAGVAIHDALILVDEATSAGLLTDVSYADRTELQFDHPLLREVLVHDLREIERKGLHLRIAQAVDELSPGVADSKALFAHHALEAHPLGDVERMVSSALEVALEAVRTFSLEEAYASFKRQLAIVREASEPPIDWLVPLVQGLSEVCILSGRLEEGEAISDWARRHARARGVSELEARAAVEVSRYYHPYVPRIAPEPALFLQEAIAGLPDRASWICGSAIGRHAIVSMHSDPAERLSAVEECFRIAQGLEEHGQRRGLYETAALASLGPDELDLQREIGEAIVRDSAKVGDLIGERSVGPGTIVGALARAGRLRDAAARTREALVCLRELCPPGMEKFARRYELMLAVFEERVDDARQTIGELEAYPVAADCLFQPIEAAFVELMIWRRDGFRDGVGERFRELRARFPSFPWRWLEPSLLVAEGRVEEAEPILAELAANDFEDLMPRMGPFAWLPIVCGLGEACVEIGEPGRSADKLYELLLPYGDRWAIVMMGGASVGAVARVLGQLAETRGDRDAAVQHISHAVATCEREGMAGELEYTRSRARSRGIHIVGGAGPASKAKRGRRTRSAARGSKAG